ncbi:GPW/gp25 family protein [Chloroherpeton thalassium ATCC 35110]|uniref:GPW/gp25 family protein n=1 Tax=Chloroherpeton thalassium (strain ATCC 35110 / GB-78) TaxID=517418 RepID=B3QTI5_CHLT3|nr:GPW/gp25 family protein [Chloroherpeton thalassium]ACF12731.1 GPW/gp25 family protein [Chloroherpeton thalassium ATCC 35110]
MINLSEITATDWSRKLGDYGNVVQGANDVSQCIHIILTTRKGEVPLRPDFGTDIYKWLDAPILQARTNIVREVTRALSEYEPRIEVGKVTVEQAEAGLSVQVAWRLKGEDTEYLYHLGEDIEAEQLHYAAPIFTYPTGGASIDQPITFKWRGAVGVNERFDFQFLDAIGSILMSLTGLVSQSYTYSASLVPAGYRVRVRGKWQGRVSEWREISFSLSIPKPANLAINGAAWPGSVTLNWAMTSVSGVISYSVMLYMGENSTTLTTTGLEIDFYSAAKAFVEANGFGYYSAKVRANASGATSEWSDVKTFQIRESDLVINIDSEEYNDYGKIEMDNSVIKSLQLDLVRESAIDFTAYEFSATPIDAERTTFEVSPSPATGNSATAIVKYDVDKTEAHDLVLQATSALSGKVVYKNIQFLIRKSTPVSFVPETAILADYNPNDYVQGVDFDETETHTVSGVGDDDKLFALKAGNLGTATGIVDKAGDYKSVHSDFHLAEKASTYNNAYVVKNNGRWVLYISYGGTSIYALSYYNSGASVPLSIAVVAVFKHFKLSEAQYLFTTGNPDDPYQALQAGMATSHAHSAPIWIRYKRPDTGQTTQAAAQMGPFHVAAMRAVNSADFTSLGNSKIAINGVLKLDNQDHNSINYNIIVKAYGYFYLERMIVLNPHFCTWEQIENLAAWLKKKYGI